MAYARHLLDRILDPNTVFHCLTAYVNATGDYNLVDRFDSQPFAPTFNAATMSIDVFSDPARKFRRLSFTLLELFPTVPISDIMADFANQHISHAYIFPIGKNGGDIAPFYLAALKLLPPIPAAQLVFWKRAAYAATDTMLIGRKAIWDQLWVSEFSPLFSFHPVLFNLMTIYKGPIPLFLQTVQGYLSSVLGPTVLHTLYNEIVLIDWHILPSMPRFLTLWHRIMKESAAVYLPSIENTVHPNTTRIKTKAQTGELIRHSDKFLCLLLLLFHQSYREQLTLILREEPTPGFLADLFSRYELLSCKVHN